MVKVKQSIERERENLFGDANPMEHDWKITRLRNGYI
jgi:hypothetical protein